MKRLLFALIGLVGFAQLSHAQAPVCAAGVSGTAPNATLTFTAPTLNTDGSAVATPLTYNLYVSSTSGAEVKTSTGLTGSPVTVTVGLLPNSTAYFKLSVVDKNGVESALSNEVCKTFPASVPGSVVIIIK